MTSVENPTTIQIDKKTRIKFNVYRAGEDLTADQALNKLLEIAEKNKK